MKKIIVTIIVTLLTLPCVCSLEAGEYPLSGFSGIDASGIFEITLRKGSGWSVSLECSDDLKDRMDVRVDGAALVLGIKNRKPGERGSKNSYAKVSVTMPLLAAVTLSGSCTLICDGRFGMDKGTFRMDLSGASSVKHLRMAAHNASVSLSGASSATLAGRLGCIVADISGSSQLGLTGQISTLKAQSSSVSRFILKQCSIADMKLEASGASSLRSDGESYVVNAGIEMTGSTSASLRVTETLDIEMTGSSCITCSGPDSLKIGRRDLSGSARFIRKD